MIRLKLPLLANRNFLLLWCAYAISALGDHLSEMAVLKTQNALGEGVNITPLQARITFAFMAPFFLLGPVMGGLADRLPRRGLMITADLVRMVVMFNFAYLIARCEVFGYWGPFVPMFFVGIFAAMFSPARSSLLPMLVQPDDLVRANAMINGLGMIATMFSAGLGGLLAKYYAPQWAFRIDAATFLCSALLLTGIRAQGSRHGGQAGFRLQASASPGLDASAQFLAGFRYVWTHRRVAQLLLIAVVFWFAGATVRSVVPAIVKNVYHGGYPAMAFFQAWLGAGLILGALIIMLLGPALRSEIAITWGLFGVGLGLLGLTLSAFLPFAPRAAHVLGAVSVVVAGTFGAAIAASYNALLQRIVPDRFRGRVFGVFDTGTILGLLIATGWLGIPEWQNIDAWVGYVLLAVSAGVIATGAWTLWVRLRASPLPMKIAFWSNVLEFIVKFWYRFRMVGRCTVPRQGAVIITANHVSTPDPLYMWAACRYRVISFMVAAEYTNIPIAKIFMRMIDCIPVRRDEADIVAAKKALRALKDGKALGIFIEGGIPVPGQPHDLKDGLALMALKTGAPVIPAHISGTAYFDDVFDSLRHRHRVEVRFGPPVDLSEFAGPGAPGRDAVRAATQKIFAAIQALAASRSPES
ncbi:MAG TPA: MFS transporter [Phycisphaerae bacterium]